MRQPALTRRHLAGVSVLAVAVALLSAAGSVALAQDPVPRPPADTTRADTLRTPADTAARRDSIPADSAARPSVDWVPADSVMQALMQRAGYTVTRYQGAVVGLDASTRTLRLHGDSAERAAVNRGDSTLVIGDTIQFNDSTRVAVVLGDTVYLEDPTQNITARGRLVYDVTRRQGLVTNLCTTVETGGQAWFVCGDQAAVIGDTTETGGSRFYAHDSRFTTCDLDVPHYHFEARNVKVIQNRLLVGRPAVMYVEGVPVAWLPFFFQDLRRGRRSGFLTPRFGVADFIRSGADYRRTIENLGYYFALNDYMDASVWMDWRSGARPSEGDPGWTRYNADLRYRWLSRFLEGSLAATFTTQQDGTRMQRYGWRHSQRFSSRTNLNLSLNYSSNTRIVRNNALLPSEALGTINSQLNLQHQRGPFNFSLGGVANQYPGRDLKEIRFPTFNMTSSPIAVGDWLVWTPRLSVTNSLTLDQQRSGDAGFQLVPRVGAPGVDTLRVQADLRQTDVAFSTPIRIFGWDWQNDFTYTESEEEAPQLVQVVDTLSPTGFRQRLFARTYLNSFDWRTSFALPPLLQGTWNLVPRIGIQNVEAGRGFLVRSERTGTRWVSQSKRIQYGVGISPTFFRLYPGIGPFERFRHAVQANVSYNYSPAAKVSDEFLLAIGTDPRSYLGALPQSQVSLTLNTNLEARYRRRGGPSDSTRTGATMSRQDDKIRLLSLNFSQIGYDFYKADTTGNGITNQTFEYSMRSDLLPGFDLRVAYDLFQGDVRSDTARFDPYRTSVSASLNLDRESPIVRGIAGLFGIDLGAPGRAGEPATLPTRSNDPLDARAGQPGVGRVPVQQLPTGQPWRASLSFSSSRSRPISGFNVIVQDPAIECEPFRFSPVAYEQCIERVRFNPPDDIGATPGTSGKPIFVNPTRSSLTSSLGFNLTPKWVASWQTSYDFTESEFASHVVTLQRELHDWFANFSFTRSPSGAFTFSFYIALKAEPDFKFDYNRQSYRGSN